MRYIDQEKSAEMMRKIMDEKSITASYIASKIGVSIATVSKWVNGKSFPEVNNLFLLSRILGVTVDDIVVGKGL